MKTEEERMQSAKEATLRYREKNKEKIAEKQRIYREKNKERLREIKRKWRENNPDKVREHMLTRQAKLTPEIRRKYNQKYQSENKEKLRRWRIENREKLVSRTMAWREKNQDRYKAYMSAYQKANPEKFHEVHMARRAQMMKSPIGDRREVRAWIKKWRSMDSVHCNWCLGEFSPKECHADHVIPLSKGGHHCTSNMVIACKTCNVSKKDKELEDWISSSSKSVS